MAGKTAYQARSTIGHLRAGMKVIAYREGKLVRLSLAADGVTIIETPVPPRPPGFVSIDELPHDLRFPLDDHAFSSDSMKAWLKTRKGAL